jgi:DNA-binding transcriptional LysR family regulator
VVISDEYDGHPRPRPAGLTFTPLHEEPLRLVLPAGHPRAADEEPVALAALRDDAWVASPADTGLHALVVGACRRLGGYEPDLRHRSNDADVLLDLVRTTGAVALLPALTLPPADAAVAIRDVADAVIRRRLITASRDSPTAPALDVLLAAVREQARRLGDGSAAGRTSRPGGATGPDTTDVVP